MIAFRRAHPILSKERFYTEAEIQWFGPQGGPPNWADPKEKQLACLIHENGQDRLFLMFNAGAEETDYGLPPLALGYRWRLAIDTSRPVPQDLSAAGEETLLDNSTTYHVEACSTAILLARKQESAPGGGSV